MGDRRKTYGFNEVGGIIGGWLLQLVLLFGVLAFVVYEVISVVVATVSLDDAAREVARSARDEYRVSRSVEVATRVASDTAALRDARVIDITQDGEVLVVVVERDAPTLVVHRIGILKDLTTVETSTRVTWTS